MGTGSGVHSGNLLLSMAKLGKTAWYQGATSYTRFPHQWNQGPGPLSRGLPGSQEAPLALHGSARVSETSLQRSWYPKYKSRYPKYKSRHLKNPGACFSRKQKPLRDDHLAATYLEGHHKRNT